jgi:hypothetical protein
MRDGAVLIWLAYFAFSPFLDITLRQQIKTYTEITEALGSQRNKNPRVWPQTGPTRATNFTRSGCSPGHAESPGPPQKPRGAPGYRKRPHFSLAQKEPRPELQSSNRVYCSPPFTHLRKGWGFRDPAARLTNKCSRRCTRNPSLCGKAQRLGYKSRSLARDVHHPDVRKPGARWGPRFARDEHPDRMLISRTTKSRRCLRRPAPSSSNPHGRERIGSR